MTQKKGHQKGSPQSKNISMNNNLSEHEIIVQFRAAMLSAGITPPESIVPDGELHRFSTNGKAKDNAGWYELKLDNIPAGSFGDFRQCPKITWNAGKSSVSAMTAAELAAHRKRVNKQKAETKRQLIKQHDQAADHARQRYQLAIPASLEHSYLLKKGIEVHNAKQLGDCLVIPLHDTGGKQWTDQAISQTGRKMLLKGGRKKGAFCVINARLSELDKVNQVYMVEGWATGASVAELYPDVPVIVAIDSGNLYHVTESIRKRWPYLTITIYADNDRKAESEGRKNVGVESAKSVANQFLNVFVEVPNFPEFAPIELSDFNDLIQWRKSQNGGVL